MKLFKNLKKDIKMYSGKTAKFFNLAINEALKSNCKQRHGAVIVRGGRVISTGYNKARNNPAIIPINELPKGVTVHAEIDALKKVRNPSGCDIYVVRIDRMGHFKLSKPCHICWTMLKYSGIKGVYHT